MKNKRVKIWQNVDKLYAEYKQIIQKNRIECLKKPNDSVFVLSSNYTNHKSLTKFQRWRDEPYVTIILIYISFMWDISKLAGLSFHYVMSHLNSLAFDTINFVYSHNAGGI